VLGIKVEDGAVVADLCKYLQTSSTAQHSSCAFSGDRFSGPITYYVLPTTITPSLNSYLPFSPQFMTQCLLIMYLASKFMIRLILITVDIERLDLTRIPPSSSVVLAPRR
jgi:hypothetical protein